MKSRRSFSLTAREGGGGGGDWRLGEEREWVGGWREGVRDWIGGHGGHIDA